MLSHLFLNFQDEECENNENIVANETVTDVQKEECKQQ